MNFWKVLKYVMMVLFALVLGVAAYMSLGDSPTANTQPVPHTSGSKFNL